MNHEFSKHSLEQMEIRNISKDTVLRILENSDQVEEVNGKKIYQSIVEIGSKKYLIRVFVNIEKKPNLIVTVYKTSNIKKFYEGKI